MFEVRRGGYKIANYANSTTLSAALGTGVISGDNIMFVFPNNGINRYGYVNASNAIVLTPQ